MGKLMILLYFILSVFPADATTNDMCKFKDTTPFPLMPPLTYISAFRRTDANGGGRGEAVAEREINYVYREVG